MLYPIQVKIEVFVTKQGERKCPEAIAVSATALSHFSAAENGPQKGGPRRSSETTQIQIQTSTFLNLSASSQGPYLTMSVDENRAVQRL